MVYEIGPRDFCIPPLTLQPIVENAVTHGVLKRESGGTLDIISEAATGTTVTITIPKEEAAR